MSARSAARSSGLAIVVAGAARRVERSHLSQQRLFHGIGIGAQLLDVEVAPDELHQLRTAGPGFTSRCIRKRPSAAHNARARAALMPALATYSVAVAGAYARKNRVRRSNAARAHLRRRLADSPVDPPVPPSP